MTDEQRARNCDKCQFRKSQECYMKVHFDYRNCPCVCVQNKMFKNLREGREKRVHIW